MQLLTLLRKRKLSSFTEQMDHDLMEVFFQEFAEECDYNHKKILAIIDDTEIVRKYASEFDALPSGSHFIFTRKNAFVKEPHTNDVAIFNGNVYTITSIVQESGMLCIMLGFGRV